MEENPYQAPTASETVDSKPTPRSKRAYSSITIVFAALSAFLIVFGLGLLFLTVHLSEIGYLLPESDAPRQRALNSILKTIIAGSIVGSIPCLVIALVLMLWNWLMAKPESAGQS